MEIKVTSDTMEYTISGIGIYAYTTQIEGVSIKGLMGSFSLNGVVNVDDEYRFINGNCGIAEINASSGISIPTYGYSDAVNDNYSQGAYIISGTTRLSGAIVVASFMIMPYIAE